MSGKDGKEGTSSLVSDQKKTGDQSTVEGSTGQAPEGQDNPSPLRGGTVFVDSTGVASQGGNKKPEIPLVEILPPGTESHLALHIDRVAKDGVFEAHTEASATTTSTGGTSPETGDPEHGKEIGSGPQWDPVFKDTIGVPPGGKHKAKRASPEFLDRLPKERTSMRAAFFSRPPSSSEDISRRGGASKIAWTALVLSVLSGVLFVVGFLFMAINKADKKDISTFFTQIGKVEVAVAEVAVTSSNAFSKATIVADSLVAIDDKVNALDDKVETRATIEDRRNAAQDRILKQLRAFQSEKASKSTVAVAPPKVAPPTASAASSAKEVLDSKKPKAKIQKQKAEPKPNLALSKASGANVTPVIEEGLTIVTISDNEMRCIFGKKGQKPEDRKYVFRHSKGECESWANTLKNKK